MRTSRRHYLIPALACAALLAGAPAAIARDVEKGAPEIGAPLRLGPPAPVPAAAIPPAPVPPAAIPPAPSLALPQPPPKYRSMREAFQEGMRGYNSGDKRGAVQALSFAAEQGHAPALWKLGRMYAAGDGVRIDHMRAFEYFQAVADQHAEDAPGSPNAPFVANAFVALGDYHLKGIAGSAVRSNPAKARKMFNYAAVYFGDSDAQFSLARLLMDGIGGPADKMQAARWLNLAAEKCHRPAQAVLGHMLFNGDGVPRQSARGLALLANAREGVDEAQSAWIVELYAEVQKVANDRDRQASQAFLRDLRCPRI
jgi:hypothetical protein